MYIYKTVRLFLTSILLISIGFSSLVISPVQAETSSAVTLSPSVTAKLDAFIMKVQALRSKYPSDADWNTFLTNLGSKINALKSQYTGNVLISAILGQLTTRINGIKIQISMTTSTIPGCSAGSLFSSTTGQACGSSSQNVTSGANNGIVYAESNDPDIYPQAPIILEGDRWGMMNLVISGVYPNTDAIVQKIRNHPGIVTADADFAKIICINGDAIYGTKASDGSCSFNLHSPNYKSATFTPIKNAPLLGEPLDSAGKGKHIVIPFEPRRTGQAYDFAIPYGQSRSFQFTTGDAHENFRFALDLPSPSLSCPTSLCTTVGTFFNISTQPNDFRYDNLEASFIGQAGLLPGCSTPSNGYYVVNPTDPVVPGCRLKPHTTYYLNMRNEEPISMKGEKYGKRGKDSASSDRSNAHVMTTYGGPYSGVPTNPYGSLITNMEYAK